MLAANKVLATNDDDVVKGGSELIKKSVELKTRRLSKSKKLSKSRNLKGEKSTKARKSSKSKNSPNFNAKKNGPSFLTLKARASFNCLRLAFTKAPIP